MNKKIEQALMFFITYFLKNLKAMNINPAFGGSFCELQLFIF